MCLDCGCMEPDNDHGDQRHITAQRLSEAAAANNSDIHQVRSNIEQTAQRIEQGELSTSASGFRQR